MLQYEPARIKPIIKDLGPHDVTPYAPAVLIPLVPQPIVTEDLGVEVVRLKGRVVDVTFRALEEEESVVVDPLIASVEAEEDCCVFTCVVMNELIRGVTC